MLANLFKRFLHWKDLGWKKFNETFYRFIIFRCRWFNIYLHMLDAPYFLPSSHDHPWDFTTIILKGGYWEQLNCGQVFFRPALSILYRSAESIHNIRTNGPAWSIVISRPKRRGWSFGHCRIFVSGDPSKTQSGTEAVDSGTPTGDDLRRRRY